MKTAVATALLAAGAASAQLSISTIETTLLSFLSTSCRSTVQTLLTNSSAATCLNVPALGAVLSSNSSIIPPIDNYLSSFCSANPCSNATLSSTADQIIAGCSSDLSSFGISNSTVRDIAAAYPLAREVLCLKTVMPAAANFTNASIPINSTAYNSTNGTFCATSLLTEVSAYWGTNLTVPYLTNLALGGNMTAVNIVKSIPRSALCQDCVFAAVDLIQEQYPTLQNQTIQLGAVNGTIDSLLEGTCTTTGLNTTTNGTLPNTIYEAAQNSSFAYNVTGANQTYTPSQSATATNTVPVVGATTASTTASTTAAARKRIVIAKEGERL